MIACKQPVETLSMQIRELKTVYQLIRTTYDETRKRGVEKMLCSFPRDALALPEQVKSALNEKELKQLEEWFQAREDKRMKEIEDMKWSRKLYQLRCAALVLSEFREALKDPSVVVEFTAEHANELWSELDAARSALRKAGFAKPRPQELNQRGAKSLS